MPGSPLRNPRGRACSAETKNAKRHTHILRPQVRMFIRHVTHLTHAGARTQQQWATTIFGAYTPHTMQLAEMLCQHCGRICLMGPATIVPLVLVTHSFAVRALFSSAGDEDDTAPLSRTVCADRTQRVHDCCCSGKAKKVSSLVFDLAWRTLGSTQRICRDRACYACTYDTCLKRIVHSLNSSSVRLIGHRHTPHTPISLLRKSINQAVHTCRC